MTVKLVMMSLLDHLLRFRLDLGSVQGLAYSLTLLCVAMWLLVIMFLLVMVLYSLMINTLKQIRFGFQWKQLLEIIRR